MSAEMTLKAIRSLPYPLALAFAFGWMIDVSLVMPEPLFSALSFAGYPHLVITTVAFATAALLNERVNALFSTPARIAAGSALCFLCVLAAGISSASAITFPVPLMLIFTAVVSLYQAFTIVFCLTRFARLPMVDCMLSLAAWQLFVALLRGLSVVTSSLFVTAIAPLIVLGCLIKMSKEGEPADEVEARTEREIEPNRWFPARLLVINMIVILTIQTLHGISQDPVTNLSYIGSLIAIVVVGLAIVANKKLVRIQYLYRASLVGLELAIIVFAIGTISAQWASSVLLDAAYALFAIFFMTTLCNACQRNNKKSVRIFAIAYMLEQVAALAGNMASGFIGADMQVLLLTLLAGLGAIAFLCLATDDDFLTAWNTKLLKTSFVDPTRYYYSLSEICSSVAMQYSLSPRESEVLLLLAQKKTSTQIGEELTLSPATVKTHVHHIYQKLGIHTKQELFELFDL